MLNTKIKAWTNPISYLKSAQPDAPVLFNAPAILHATARRFLQGFPGLVTFAVKANPDEAVITNLLAAGIKAFDVASPFEIALMRRLGGNVVLHYHNPVKSKSEIEFAHKNGVKSYALDSHSELKRIAALVPATGTELSVRFKLNIKGGHYDFGSKFGLVEDEAATLLKAVADAGFTASLTFHPGTQCVDPAAYTKYIHAAARIASAAGVTIHRLNVGGGFPSRRGEAVPELEVFFAAIDAAMSAFATRPALVCEPGRGMVGPAFALAVGVKAIRDNGDVFLNDGIYGGLTEFPYLTVNTDFTVHASDGRLRQGPAKPARVFGPTCDSADVVPAPMYLPDDLDEGDFILFFGMGAYVLGLNTAFNGYGNIAQISVLSLT